jgi:hypothetical protein
MELHCNGEAIGDVEHVEWKDEASDEEGGTVTFMAPFDFDWEDKQHAFLELSDPEGSERYVLSQIKKVDPGSAGTFVVARYKQMGT